MVRQKGSRDRKRHKYTGWDEGKCKQCLVGKEKAPRAFDALPDAVLRASDRQGCKSYGAPLGPLLLPLLWLLGHKSNWRRDCYWVLTVKLWQEWRSGTTGRPGSAFMAKGRELK